MPQTNKQIAMLIVEDKEFMRQTLREFVQAAYPQATVLEAAEGARALELCLALNPQLVLMDVALPDANGIDVTARIKQALPQTIVIMVSQHAAEVYVERARAAGAFAYIRKDEVYRELLPAISRALSATAGSADGDSQ